MQGLLFKLYTPPNKRELTVDMPSTRNGAPQTTPSGGVVGQQETPTKEEKEGKVEEDESSASDEDSFSCKPYHTFYVKIHVDGL